MTTATKSELSQRVLGTDRLARGRANCTIHSHRFEVDLFDGIGDEWIAYASRLRVRGGFTAIDPRACQAQPAACAAIQRVLERDPTLHFNPRTGRFQPAHTLASPAPPPPPTPPPLYVLYRTPPPPPFPPVPSPPPPWYAHAETCVPITTAAENEIETADGLERSVCVYVRAIADERVRAEKCFATMSPSPPPPPPRPTSRLAAMTANILQRQVRQGGTDGAQAAPTEDSFDQYSSEASVARDHQVGLLESLANDNFQLRGLLGNIVNRLDDTQGRRLWQRDGAHTSHNFIDNVLAQTAFGNAPIVGVTQSECEALCNAIQNETLGTCQAVAFARANADPRYVPLLEPTTPSFTHAPIYSP